MKRNDVMRMCVRKNGSNVVSVRGADPVKKSCFKKTYIEKRIVYFELIVLILSSFAFSYVVAEVTPDSENLLFPLLKNFFDELTEPIIPFVSAAGVGGCCAQSTAGVNCASVDSTNCATSESFVPGTACERVSFCEKGCCYDEDEGIFSPNTLEHVCDMADWVSDPNCNLPGAALGCCVLGESTRFETQGQCKINTQDYALSSGYDIDWRTGLSEVDCILLAGEQKMGACVLPDGDCKFGSQASCEGYSGEFNEDVLCTAKSLNTTCEKTEKTTCVDGKDQVYFVDSCGNVANIYDERRAKDNSYWETYVEPESACFAANGAADSSTCGNCNRIEGGACALAKPDNFDVVMGDYYCKKTSCEHTDDWGVTNQYKNGESWCVYNSPIGSGDDVPGSRHFRYVCNDGVVKVEPCADYRNEICIEQDTLRGGGTEIVGSGGSSVAFHNAVCRKNNAKNCIAIGESSMDACNDEPDCMVRSVEVGGPFSFSICVPMYPEGFSFETEYQVSGSQVCAINTRTCTVIFAPPPFCPCFLNCGCLSPGFGASMDEVCTALGDCGSAPNYNQAGAVRGKVAEYDPRVEKYMLAAGLTYDDYLGVGSSLFEQSAFSGALFAKKLDPEYPAVPEGTSNSGAGIGAAITAIGAAITALAGIMGSTLMATAAAVMSAMGGIFGALAAGPTSCPPVIVPYTCNLWSAPTGDSSCGACSANPDIPCTEYACNTLGTACDFINKGSDNELCVAAPDNGYPPTITPVTSLEEIIASLDLQDSPDLLAFLQEVEYVRLGDNHLKINNLAGGCVDAYSPIPISFTTDEVAKCRLDFEEKDFEDMEFDVGTTDFVFKHETFFRIPDPSHGRANNISLPTDMTIYVLCQDRRGDVTPEYFQIDMCVNDGPDETAPLLVSMNPPDGSVISFDSDNFTAILSLEEMATCRWDSNSETSYDNMVNEFVCDDMWGQPSGGWVYVCRGDLPIDLTEGVTENKFNVKCADQPWLIGGDDENERNVNILGYDFTYIRPSGKIAIESITPSDEELVTTSDRISFDFVVKTTDGGMNHGCDFSLTGYETMVPFIETDVGKTHTHSFDLTPNKYDVFVECGDETGDTVRQEVSIRVIQKGYSPLISRVWHTSNNIRVVTQEEADCRFSKDDCLFSFENGTGMSGDGITHRVSVEKGAVYHIRCKDNLGNVPAGCSIVVGAA